MQVDGNTKTRRAKGVEGRHGEASTLEVSGGDGGHSATQRVARQDDVARGTTLLLS